MSVDNKPTYCPQCGAMGTAGEYCQYCGNKIPLSMEKENGSWQETFSWYNVCPQDWEPATECIVGLDTISFMVVEKHGLYQKHSAIINKSGRFEVDPTASAITLYSDNLDYLIDNRLRNLGDSDLEVTFGEICCKDNEDYIVYTDSEDKSYRIYKRKTREEIQLNRKIPEGYIFDSVSNNIVLLSRRIGKGTVDCVVRINDYYGEVEIDEEREQELIKADEEEKEKRRKEARRFKICAYGCGLIFVALLLGGIGFFIHLVSTPISMPNYPSTIAEDESMEKTDETQRIINKMSLGLFFYKSKVKAGHFRQDLANRLTAIGFVKQVFKDDDYEGFDFRGANAARYVHSSGGILLYVSINKGNTDISDNQEDKVRKIEIEVAGDADIFAQDKIIEKIAEKLKSELSEYGFSENKVDLMDVDHPLRPFDGYMRMGRETSSSGTYKKLATWDYINLDGIGHKIRMHSQDEIAEEAH